MHLQVLAGITWRSDDLKNATLATCGRLWVSTDGGVSFAPTTHDTYRVSTTSRSCCGNVDG